ncbi:MAG: hypothetical protein HN345_02160 [Planctomycetaceae bacterium]|nr:hypothetical protein [Planctomycetaceae bacterium]
MNERSDLLCNLIQGEQIKQAIELVQDAYDYHESEHFVFTVLKEEKSTPELVEAVLEAFLRTRENHRVQHGYWVHSLSHFTDILWERRMVDWIKKFNEVSFKGAIELHDTNCSDRLVCDFGRYARFNDDPADFYLTPDNLSWMNWEFNEYAKERIETGRFESEEAFLRWKYNWKLQRPEKLIKFDYDLQTDLVDIEQIRSLIQKLQELGADISKFNDLEKDLLTKHLSKLESELSETEQDWRREGLEKAIQKTRAALDLCK